MRDYATKDKLLYGPSGRVDRRAPSSRRAGSRVPKRRKISSWVWMCVGLVIGVVCIILAWVWGSGSLHQQWTKLKKHEKVASNTQPISPSKAGSNKLANKTTVSVNRTASGQLKPHAHQKAVSKSSQPKETEPHFDFYTILPKQKVEAKIEPAQKKGAAASRQFMLQVASYQDYPSANAMLKRLQKLGLKSKVDKVGSGSAIWYRVDLGPYSSVRSADVVRHTLQNNGINGAMIRQLPK